MSRKQDKVVVMAAYSLKPFDDRTEQVLQFAERVIRILVDVEPQLLEKFSPWQFDRLGHQQYGSFYGYSNEAFNRLRQYVLVSPHMFGFDYYTARRTRSPYVFRAIFNDHNAYREPQYRDNLYGIAIHFEVELFKRIGQETCLDLFREMIEICSANTGYIDFTMHSAEGALAFHTHSVAFSENRELRRERIDREVPGYCWGVLLTEKHIYALGGVSAIEKSEAYKHVCDWSAPNREALLLLATDDVLGFNNTHRLSCKQFLLPILPPLSYLAVAFGMKASNYKGERISVFAEEEQRILNCLAELPKEKMLEVLMSDEESRLEFVEAFLKENLEKWN